MSTHIAESLRVCTRRPCQLPRTHLPCRTHKSAATRSALQSNQPAVAKAQGRTREKRTLRPKLRPVGPRERVFGEALKLVIAARLCATRRVSPPLFPRARPIPEDTQLQRFVVYVFIP
jgi:hypothetical protein